MQHIERRGENRIQVLDPHRQLTHRQLTHRHSNKVISGWMWLILNYFGFI